ncbi:magnesium-translocating P-type ATPase [Methanobacterium alcaliphilum]|uniref:magnesium-translocating P-type ATPase n=1 Tax=Methanobacterium alcaliphilum TaxID=392018 RepID=UPI00200A70C8|nr:magnesium-translocating P-type ATPase [Methanobacterium alcaliphilum]MCK9151033.1 magnesium-translocating P-type ATPase [Methanobacterium alcaliphilum]
MKKTKKDATNIISRNLIEFSLMDIENTFKSFNTSTEGLNLEESVTRLEKYGKNEIKYEKQLRWYVQLFKSFINPFIGVLIFIALISFTVNVVLATPADRDYKLIIVVIIMVLISGLLHFFQEHRSNQEAEKLKKMVKTTATVIRKGRGKQEIDLFNLVPGDIIHLSAGDMVPADVRIISSKDLFVSQSALTGESEPSEKYNTSSFLNIEKTKINVLDLDNICFMGTNIVSGSALALVLSTGNKTYFGSIAKSLAGKAPITSFERGVNNVSWLLIRFMVVMVPIVFVINGITKNDWVEALLFAVSIAVGLTPEMLPMIVTSNLAKGAVTMAKHKTVVKKLDSIQNFGAMDILCTDKTGTLTLDKIVLEFHLDIHGNEDDRILRHAYLNSYYQTGLKNVMDNAILEFGSKKECIELNNNYSKIDEIPFDFSRRRMSVVLENNEGKRQLITKGAVEEMLDICSFAEYQGNVELLTDEIRSEINGRVEKFNKEGFRVIAVAQKNDVPEENIFDVQDESDMVLMGYLAFLDPPKKSAPETIKALQEHGISVKIITGDNELVTQNICKKVGLPIDNILMGYEIGQMKIEELAKAAENTTIFAKVSPLDKAKIINALKSNNHTVGFIGDGINDASALRESDVGISVDSAVDIAKESADIILLEKNLMVLEKGVLQGRNTFGNILKYIKMTASSNFGNVFSVLVASAFLPFLPMLPIMLLMQNLLYDISQTTIPWDTMDKSYLKKPRKWDASDIGRFMIFIGPISSIFDIATFWVMWYIFAANSIEVQSLFQTGWFIEGLLSQTLIVHMIRTKKIPFIQSRASTPVLLMTGIIMTIGIILPFTSVGAAIGLQALPITYFPWLICILILYFIITQLLKTIYIQKFNRWL